MANKKMAITISFYVTIADFNTLAVVKRVQNTNSDSNFNFKVQSTSVRCFGHCSYVCGQLYFQVLQPTGGGIFILHVQKMHQ